MGVQGWYGKNVDGTTVSITVDEAGIKICHYVEGEGSLPIALALPFHSEPLQHPISQSASGKLFPALPTTIAAGLASAARMVLEAAVKADGK